jgi:hypothetical protein
LAHPSTAAASEGWDRTTFSLLDSPLTWWLAPSLSFFCDHQCKRHGLGLRRCIASRSSEVSHVPQYQNALQLRSARHAR